MSNEQSINKRQLWHYVNRKINRMVHHYHVLGVITILFDEMIKDLRQDKEIKIGNFGTFVMKRLNPRKYFDVRERRVMLSEGHRIIRFILAPRLRKKLVSRLDLDRTLKDD